MAQRNSCLTWHPMFLALILTLGIARCAVLSCHRTVVIVADKAEPARLDTGPAPLRTTETGRLEEAIRPTFVREYWVRSREGQWYRVSAAEFQTAQIGQPLEICR